MSDSAASLRFASLFDRRVASLVLAATVLLGASPAAAQTAGPATLPGRWDLRVSGPEGTYPSWLEVTESGRGVLVGRFVGRVGSARPVGRMTFEEGVLRFAIPPQWEAGTGDLALEARLDGEGMGGTITTPSGERHTFTGSRAEALRRPEPEWGAPEPLFNGRDLAGWTTQGPGDSHWAAENDLLRNAAGGANLRTARSFEDFKLHVEFRYPEGGNSGVYLRGRHEVQIEDSREEEWPASTHIGGVYGFLAPVVNAASGPDRWQTFDITLVGRRVTIVLNGEPILVDQVIPGITGGALDSEEHAPGPILLQGDHTAVEFRNITVAVPRGGGGR